VDYVYDLLVPILGGLFLGHWLETQWGWSPLVTVGLGMLGMVAGLAIVYRRLQKRNK
jgi:F0F1-type ATP synthase assembly protein I